MTKLTPHDALCKLKTIPKRIARHEAAILSNASRRKNAADPLKTEKIPGGSPEFIARHRQAVSDLSQYRLAVKRALSDWNNKTMVVIGSLELNITQAMYWKQHVLPDEIRILEGLLKASDTAKTKPDDPLSRFRQSRNSQDRIDLNLRADAQDGLTQFELHFDEADVHAQLQKLELQQDRLDSLLSVMNGQDEIEVPDEVPILTFEK